MKQYEIDQIKKNYPEGTRIRLKHMEDSQAVPDGTWGTVKLVDDTGTIHMHWENGSGLGLIPKEDQFEIMEMKFHYKEKEVTPLSIQIPLTRSTERMFMNDLHIESIIELSEMDFAYFKAHLNEDYNFIRQHRDLLSKNDRYDIPCLLVKGFHGIEGIIVQSDASNLAEYYSYIPDTTSIVQQMIPTKDKDLMLKAHFMAKEPRLESMQCKVEKIISLSKEDFEYFTNHLLKEYPFLKENKESMYVDGNEICHCLLVIGEGHQEGVLVGAQGYGYARYTSMFSNAREWMKQHYLIDMIEDVFDINHFKEEQIQVLIVEPNQSPYVKIIPNTLEAKQEIVGGYIECVALSDTADILCNEGGKLLKLEPNRRYKDDVLVGTFIIVGNDESEDFCSLSKEDIKKYMIQFQEPENISYEEIRDPNFRLVGFE